MALEGLLSKLGPTLVREVTPHVMQLVGGLTERFRKDTREIKATVDAEMAAIARTHAGLVTSVDDQAGRLELVREQIAVVDRKIELLHKTVETLGRHLASEAESAAGAQRSARTFAVISAIFSALACGAAVTVLVLHR